MQANGHAVAQHGRPQSAAAGGLVGKARDGAGPALVGVQGVAAQAQFRVGLVAGDKHSAVIGGVVAQNGAVSLAIGPAGVELEVVARLIARAGTDESAGGVEIRPVGQAAVGSEESGVGLGD